MTYQYRGKKTFDESYLRGIVERSTSKHEVITELGLPPKGTYGYRTLNYFLDLYSIDVSHFVGRSGVGAKLSIPVHEILDGKHPLYGSNQLKLRLLRDGFFEHACSECKLREWRGKPIPLDLDHINGKSWDHRLTNLRLLCRNCHAQTENFCGKNRHGEKPAKVPTAMEGHRLRQEELAKLVLESSIDFSSFGWVSKVATIIHQKPQKVNIWMQKYLPELYATCFKRKSLHD